jgi:hypothetical protein
MSLSFTSKQNGRCDLKLFQVEIHAVVRFLQAGVGQSKIHRRMVSFWSQKVFSQKDVWRNKFKDDRTVLNGDPEKHVGRQRTSHTDENYVTIEDLLGEN